MKKPYDIGEASWSIGKWWSSYYNSLTVVDGKIKRRIRPGDEITVFCECFPDILKICKGDKIREATLFYVICMFNHGYHWSGLGLEYAKREAENSLEKVKV